MPRKAKKFSRRTKKRRVLAPAPNTNRSSKRKQWSDQQMRDPIDAASSGVLSVNRAADTHSVPRSKLKDRLSGRVVHGTKATPLGYLSNTPSTARRGSSGQCTFSSGGSTISRFLGSLSERTPSQPSVKKSFGARLLTSAECLALLEEKKRREKEEKEQRKLTRELNKKKRKEEQKRKAEERAKKAAEKQAEKKKKEVEKVAKLAAQAAEKAAKQATQESRQGDASISRKRPIPRDCARDSTRQKAPKLSTLDMGIDPNTCCACFGLYEDNWL